MSDRNIRAIQHAAEYARQRGVRVDFEPGWENRSGARNGRDTDPQVIYIHHTGGDNTSVAYLRDGDKARGLGTLANFAIRQNGDVVVIAARYANTQGYGNRAAHDLLASNPPMDREVKPGPDGNFSANGLGFGIEVIDRGDAFTAEAYNSTIIFSAGLVEGLNHSRVAPPIGGHKEFTRRKSDPWHNMSEMRRNGASMLAGNPVDGSQVETVPAPVVPDTTKPVDKVNPNAPIQEDGKWGEATNYALQESLKNRWNAYGWNGQPLAIDGIDGRNTYRALQRVLNQELKAGLQEDGILGSKTIKALQRFVGSKVDGKLGPDTIRAMQAALNRGKL